MVVDENSIAPDIEYLRNLIKLLKTFTNVDFVKCPSVLHPP